MEGDCDHDSDCHDGLVCGIDNCKRITGIRDSVIDWDDTDDCCAKGNYILSVHHYMIQGKICQIFKMSISKSKIIFS